MVFGVLGKYIEEYNCDENFLKQVLNSFYVDDFTVDENILEKAYELFKILNFVYWKDPLI